MSTTSPLLKLTLQDLGENVDIWGSILNVSALRLLEDGIAGTATVTLVSTADVTLDDTAGGPTAATGARYMILNITGSPGGATNVIAPTRSKVYLAWNNTGDSSDVTVKTSAGAGVTVPAGEAQWVFCDGTDIVAASVAVAATATTAAFATNSNQLGGVDSTEYALKASAQTFTAGQVVSRSAVSSSGGSLTLNCATSNAFYLVTTESFTLQAPTNATNGQQFSIAIQQGGGGPHTIAFAANTFVAVGGSAPVLSTTAGDVDYLAFEYVTGLAAPFSGNRWVVSILKDLSGI